MTKSPSQIFQIIESILRSPVRVSSAEFRELQRLRDDGDISDSNAPLANKAFAYCYLCEAFHSQPEPRRDYIDHARGIIEDNKLIEKILEDIAATLKNFQHSSHTQEDPKTGKIFWDTPEDKIDVAKKYAQIAFGIYSLYRDADGDLLKYISKSAYYFLHYVSMGALDEIYLDSVHQVLNDDSFCQLFLYKRIKKIMKNQRALASCNIHFLHYIFDYFASQEINTPASRKIKRAAGYLIILYNSEQHRMAMKRLQELLNDKRESTLLFKTIKALDKHTSFDICGRFKLIRESNEKVNTLRSSIKNIEKEIDLFLSDNDVRQGIKELYEMKTPSARIDSLISRSELLFYKTGSTSIILKFTHANDPTILKLVKPCFFTNDRIKYATKQLKEYYESEINESIIYESSEKYAIMEFIEGKTITEFTTSSNSDDNRFGYLSNILKIITDIFGLLENLHSRDKFHKDLSKDNIIISTSDLTPKFIDFGQNYVIADVSSADQYADISISIAPEVLSCSVKNEFDFIWSDLYSAGIIVLELYSNRVAKDKNVLATLLDETWEKSPSLAYLIELLIDERVENRKEICAILNSDCSLLKNLLPDKVYSDENIANKKIVQFVEHNPGVGVSNRENRTKNFSDEEVGLHYYLQRCIKEIINEELASLKAGRLTNRALLATVIHEFSSFYKSAKLNVEKIAKNFLLTLPLLLSVCFFPFIHKWLPRRVFIKDYLSFFKKLSSFSWMIAWFFGVGFFARFFHDTINNKELLLTLENKWFDAFENFFSFMPWISHKMASHAASSSPSSIEATVFPAIAMYIVNKVEGLYNDYFNFIYKFYTPENWDIILSALIVGTTFVMCATPYYKIIFSNISFMDFFKFTPDGKSVSSMGLFNRCISTLKTLISEMFVRSTSFIHIIPIVIGMCNPTFWATCSWIGVIPVTVNSFINTRYLKKTYKIYTDKSYFVLPISNAVKETVDKFSYWHVLLIAYIVVLLVGDFGLRGNIIQDWLMYSFLVAVVNVVKMQVFNCYKEGPGVHSTIYRCYAACLRSKYLTKSQH